MVVAPVKSSSILVNKAKRHTISLSEMRNLNVNIVKVLEQQDQN